MSKMSFDKFQVLARKVFPTLPSDFEQMPDETATYKFVLSFEGPCDFTSDQGRIDAFSCINWCRTMIYNAQVQANRSA